MGFLALSIDCRWIGPPRNSYRPSSTSAASQPFRSSEIDGLSIAVSGVIFYAPAAADRFDQIQFYQPLQIPVGGFVNYMKAGSAPAIWGPGLAL